ncbi:hypothetical protein HU200_057166 [Digitaria exilis]|uniref:BPM/SPOP BACK domain-containing protein n=1 Tax=Digitaria exilis TaxID=1010633 RepID=A0A835AFF0_9POAL|nr:hypothetical protein HU200_057166 [Digitaria exilis]
MPLGLAQHLLVAADRCGLDRLKMMYERKLAIGIRVGMVATTLALAEQENCSRLNTKCIEFIAGGSWLQAPGCEQPPPLVPTEFLKAAYGKKRSRSPDAN